MAEPDIKSKIDHLTADLRAVNGALRRFLQSAENWTQYTNAVVAQLQATVEDMQDALQQHIEDVHS